jgi:hypothetical protein
MNYKKGKNVLTYRHLFCKIEKQMMLIENGSKHQQQSQCKLAKICAKENQRNSLMVTNLSKPEGPSV